MNQRLFLAIKIEPDKHIKDIYFNLKKILRGERVKFYDINQLMLIIRYLGDIPTEFLSDINRQIAPVINSTPSFDLKINGVDIYPYDIMPRVLWLRVEQNPVLMQLANDLENTIHNLTGHEEDFAFYPHITFARIRFIKNMQRLDLVKKYNTIEAAAYPVKQIILYETTASKQGNQYRVRNRFDLLG